MIIVVIAAAAAVAALAAYIVHLRGENAFLQGQLSALGWNGPAPYDDVRVQPPASAQRPLATPVSQAPRAAYSWRIPDDYLDQLVSPVSIGDKGVIRNVPPQMAVTLSMFLRTVDPAPYSFPLGWAKGADGSPDVISATFYEDPRHIEQYAMHVLITGTSGAGKDTAIFLWLTGLCLLNPPERLRLLIMTKKKQDAGFWKGKAHLLRPPAVEDHELSQATEYLVSVLDERESELEKAGVRSWESYIKRGGKMPLIVVLITELDALVKAIGKSEMDEWLSAFLTRCRAAGIRLIMAPNTVSQKSTNWRSQMRMFFSGYNDGTNNDQPNTYIPPDALEKLGGIRPSEIPGPGIWTCRILRNVAMVTTPLLAEDDIRAFLGILEDAKPGSSACMPWTTIQPEPVAKPRLPEPMLVPQLLSDLLLGEMEAAPAPPEVAAQPVEAEETPEAALAIIKAEPPVPDIEVPEEDRKRILEAATRLSSRRKICQELYGSPGGDKYIYISTVLKPFEKDPLPLDPQKLTSATQTTLAA